MKPRAGMFGLAAASAALVGCGGDATETPASESAPSTVTSTTTPGEGSSTVDATDPAAATTAPGETSTTSPATTMVPPETSTTTPPPDVQDQSLDVPGGTFVAAPGDAIVLGVDGDLELRPRLIGTIEDPAVPLVDNPDPRDEVTEGPGPNVIEDVAGIVNGSLIYGDCCEPVSGNLYALTEPGAEPVLIGVGYHPVLSPDGSLLAAANDHLVQVASTADGVGVGRLLMPGADGGYRSALDVGWTSDDEVVLLTSVMNEGFFLVAYDPATLEQTARVPLEVGDVEGTSVRFAGNRSDGMLAVSIRTPDQTTIRFVEPGTLASSSDTRTLPADVTSVEFADGLGLLWVDDEVLYYLPTGQFEANPLATGVLAAWPLDSA